MKSLPGIFFLSLAVLAVHGQSFKIDWFTVDAGGGVRGSGPYSLSGTIGQPDAAAKMAGGSYSLTGGFWSLLAVQTPGAPILFIQPSGTNIVLFWSAEAGDFLLEHNTNLVMTNAWSAVLPAPVRTNGFSYVTNALAPVNHFYRLQREAAP